MAILASLPGINPFSSLPTNPNSQNTPKPPPKPPIPIPKYPPPSSKKPKTTPPEQNAAFKLPHRRTKYYKPIKQNGIISSDGDRSVIINENGVSYKLPGAPFEFQFSYSETPKVKPLAIREPAFLPFGPTTMPRPWTGKAPLKRGKKRDKIPLFKTLDSDGMDAVRRFEMAVSLELEKVNKVVKSREEILGEPLQRWEIKKMIKPLISDNRQVNLGRDGLTHNMLELIHSHWRRNPVCKVRCKGIPTVDMRNICRSLEERTGGKVIYRIGGVVYLFAGRNYDYKNRPKLPVMLWKPAAPVYPKLIQDAPEGLTKEEADEFREKGKILLPICKLAKNGVYISLVKDVRDAFEGSQLVKVDCKGMDPSDYKKLGAKLKDLVPCVLLSFDDEQILMWRGKNWKSRYQVVPSVSVTDEADESSGSDEADESSGSDESDNFDDDSCNPEANVVHSSPKMISLWKRAIESSKAIVLDQINLEPDDLLRKVEEFESISQATEHSYPAVISSIEDGASNKIKTFGDDSVGEIFFEEEAYTDDNEYEDIEYYDSDLSDEVDSSVPLGSLPIDRLAERLDQER